MGFLGKWLKVEYDLLWIIIFEENDLPWKMICHGKWFAMENDLPWKMVYRGKRFTMENCFPLKMVSLENDLPWKLVYHRKIICRGKWFTAEICLPCKWFTMENNLPGKMVQVYHGKNPRTLPIHRVTAKISAPLMVVNMYWYDWYKWFHTK